MTCCLHRGGVALGDDKYEKNDVPSFVQTEDYVADGVSFVNIRDYITSGGNTLARAWSDGLEDNFSRKNAEIPRGGGNSANPGSIIFPYPIKEKVKIGIEGECPYFYARIDGVWKNLGNSWGNIITGTAHRVATIIPQESYDGLRFQGKYMASPVYSYIYISGIKVGGF